MTETTETFGSKLLNTVMEAMFSEEMTELEAWVERMERLYPPGMDKPRTPVSGLPQAWQEWAGQSAIIRTDSPESFQYVRNGYMTPQDVYNLRRRYDCLNTDALTGAGTSLLGGLFGGLF